MEACKIFICEPIERHRYGRAANVLQNKTDEIEMDKPPKLKAPACLHDK